MSRPPISVGEKSVPVNVRLPEFQFDQLCAVAKFAEHETGERLSLAEVIRRYIPQPVDEVLYGAIDGRPPLDARIVDVYLELFREAEVAARKGLMLVYHMQMALLQAASDYQAGDIDGARKSFGVLYELFGARTDEVRKLVTALEPENRDFHGPIPKNGCLCRACMNARKSA